MPVDLSERLVIRSTCLKVVKEYEMLGIIIDDRLNFKSHICFMLSKLSRSVGAMYKVSSVAPKYVLKNMYFCLIYSRLSYCILAYGGGSATSLHRVRGMQRRAIKLMSGGSECCTFHDLDLLDLDEIYTYFSLIKLYRIFIQNEHAYFLDRINSYQVPHSHDTRFTSAMFGASGVHEIHMSQVLLIQEHQEVE